MEVAILSHLWDKNNGIQEHLKLNDNKNITHKNLWNATKVAFTSNKEKAKKLAHLRYKKNKKIYSPKVEEN